MSCCYYIYYKSVIILEPVIIIEYIFSYIKRKQIFRRGGGIFLKNKLSISTNLGHATPLPGTYNPNPNLFS